MPRPPECEFSMGVKVEALKRASFCCERCGIPKHETFEGYLDIHHRLGIALALKYYPEISYTVIASIANARVLCKKCHHIEDMEDRKRHRELAQRLAGVPRQMRLAMT